jgi:hypothetical protein
MANWCNFLVLVHCSKKNLANLYSMVQLACSFSSPESISRNGFGRNFHTEMKMVKYKVILELLWVNHILVDKYLFSWTFSAVNPKELGPKLSDICLFLMSEIQKTYHPTYKCILKRDSIQW